MKIIYISVSKFSQPRYHYLELHNQNHKRFETPEEFMSYIKKMPSRRKYEIHISLPETESKLEQRIKNHFLRSTFITE